MPARDAKVTARPLAFERAGLVLVPVIGIGALLLSPGAQALVAVLLVLTVGVPHGASDHLVAASDWRTRFGRGGVAAFFTAYLAVAGTVATIWSVAPIPALLAFLLLSALHFGSDDLGRPLEWRLVPELAARGLLPLCGPALLHRDALAGLLLPLAGQATNGLVQVLSFLGGAALSALLTALTVAAARRDRLAVLELVLIALFAVLFPPLLGFALYFSAIHSRRQIGVRCRVLRLSLAHYYRRCAPLIAGGAAIVLLALLATPSVTAALIIGLAAMTVPHMMLVPHHASAPAPASGHLAGAS